MTQTHAPALDREEHDAAALLADTRARVDPLLRAAVHEMPPALARIAAYHFGWCAPDGTPANANPGKAIRPALVLAAARALGGRSADALPAAAAVEITHNFTLLHDDVMDRDRTRRHRPTAWTVYGVPDAILSGDALAALAMKILAEQRHPAAARAVSLLSGCVIELCDGQQSDCAFESRAEVSLDQCLRMAEAKTGALLGASCALGALYAGAGEEAVAAMDRFGRRIGLAFQLVDDLIGIWGDPAVTGKPAGADLVSRKKSLPVVAALSSHTPAAAHLAELYATTRPLVGADLRRAADAVQDSGARAWAQSEAADLMAGAVAQLAATVADPDAAGDLLALAELATRRTC